MGSDLAPENGTGLLLATVLLEGGAFGAVVGAAGLGAFVAAAGLGAFVGAARLSLSVSAAGPPGAGTQDTADDGRIIAGCSAVSADTDPQRRPRAG